MCPEYEYINLDVGSSGTGELSKALPKIERTARLVPAAERPAGRGRLDVGQVEGGQLTFTVCLYAGGGCFLFRN